MKEIEGIFQHIKPIKTTPVQTPGVKPAEGKQQGSFSDVLTQAMTEVNSLQKEADVKVAGLVAGSGGVTPHDAMIALEKADIAFNLMTQIRSKIVRAYEEVMRTQV